MLLEHSWLHKNGAIPSILHQCFKYYKNGHVKKVFGDVKPFTEAESYHANAKYFMQDVDVTKVVKSANEDRQLENHKT